MNERENSKLPVTTEELRELAAIEAELAALVPGPARLDRDRTMFLAGQAASPSTHAATLAAKLRARIWPLGCAAMTAASVCLLFAVVSQQREIVALRSGAADSAIDSSAAAIAVLSGPRRPQEDSGNSMEAAANADASRARGATIAQLSRLRIDESEPLSVRSLVMSDEPSTKTTPARDWPQYAYGSPSPPLPYYKLLRQLQHQEIQ